MIRRGPLPLVAIVCGIVAFVTAVWFGAPAARRLARQEAYRVTLAERTDAPCHLLEGCPASPSEVPAPAPIATPTATPSWLTHFEHLLPLYERILRAIPHGWVVADHEPWDCEDEAIVDVAGAREPRGCSAVAIVNFSPGGGLDGMVKVYHFRTKAALGTDRALQLRYMRQYDGLRRDVAVPGLANSRMIWTGSAGDLLEVVFTRGQDLVMVWLSAGYTDALTAAQQRIAVNVAHTVDRLLASG